LWYYSFQCKKHDIEGEKIRKIMNAVGEAAKTFENKFLEIDNIVGGK